MSENKNEHTHADENGRNPSLDDMIANADSRTRPTGTGSTSGTSPLEHARSHPEKQQEDEQKVTGKEQER